jgi:hypothetical protein
LHEQAFTDARVVAVEDMQLDSVVLLAQRERQSTS